MGKEKKINIGHDPLAWMAESEHEEESTESSQSAEISDKSVNEIQQTEILEELQLSVSESDSIEKNLKDNVEISTESSILENPAVDLTPVKAISETVQSVEVTQEKTSDVESHAPIMDNMMQVSEKNDWITITLPSNMTLPYLDDLQAQLNDFLGQPIYFSAKNVQRVDTAALQLLLSFIQQNKTIRWDEPSNQLCNAAMLLNLSPHLNLPSSS